MRILMMFKLNGQLNGYQARAVMNVLMARSSGISLMHRDVLCQAATHAHFLTERDETWE